jgi:hypothetical protein
MEGQVEVRKAGAKALDEIRKAVLELLEILDSKPEDETIEEAVLGKLGSILGRYEGTYWYNGWNGWEHALKDPNEEPFNSANW